jgi:hypothetical protein
MSVRVKLALTIFATGLLTALLVIASVVYAFQRFENETAYRRGMGFLGRVVSMYDNIFDMHEKDAPRSRRGCARSSCSSPTPSSTCSAPTAPCSPRQGRRR